MASLALGTVFAFVPGVRFINTACTPLQGTGPLPSLRRARPLIGVTCE